MTAHIVMVPFTGCGINPARSFGPMAANSIGGVNTWSTGWWIFYVAPFVGAGLAAMTYRLIFAEDGKEDDDVEKELSSPLTEDEESLAASIFNSAFAEDEEEDDKTKKRKIPESHRGV
ncbi:unnamed protein product [Cylindrotheca closterium]|uniref:Aquaporin n=1 Tax=Cylindrotheca closterium TaxID=2856 RepID=A0AAD2FKK5_9STRA|nr:unnamed protein product [Cylindrotheca closterium]